MTRAAASAPLRAVDFERLLSARPCARSEHFVLHHVPASRAAVSPELSTPREADEPTDVDDTRFALASERRFAGDDAPGFALDDARRFALVVPKRHARRAVTRSLIKRQGRAQFVAHAGRLAAGDWLLRLRSGFALPQFPSAASPALRCAVRGELQTLFGRVAAPAP